MTSKLLCVIMLALSSSPAWAVRSPSFRSLQGDSDPANCPRVQFCSAAGCFAPEKIADLNLRETLPVSNFSGLKLPASALAKTNFPLLNAGLQHYRKTGRDAYLRWAAGIVCSIKSTETLSCSGPWLGTSDTTEDPAPEPYPIWSRDTTLEAQYLGCIEYATRARAAEFALRPSVSLQSNPLSNEGIAIRLGLGKTADSLPGFLVRCREAGNLSVACGKLVAFADDVKFALLLADKLVSDGANSASQLELIYSGNMGADKLASTAADLGRLAETPGLEAAFNTILISEWPRLRAAIQRGIDPYSGKSALAQD